MTQFTKKNIKKIKNCSTSIINQQKLRILPKTFQDEAPADEAPAVAPAPPEAAEAEVPPWENELPEMEGERAAFELKIWRCFLFVFVRFFGFEINLPF